MREAVSGRIDQLEAEVKQVKLQTKVRILGCGERDVMGVTCLSRVGYLKEELAATDRSWEEEKKDLEQQLQARQGPKRRNTWLTMFCLSLILLVILLTKISHTSQTSAFECLLRVERSRFRPH